MRGTRSLFGGFRSPLLALVLLTGCSLGTDLDRPKWARLVLTAPTAVSLELLTSQNFLVSESSVQLVDSTFSVVTLPFDQRYTLGAPARIYIRARNAGEDTVSFHFKAFLERRTWVDEDKTLGPGEFTDFVYRYNEPAFY